MLGGRLYYNYTINGILFLDEVSKSGTMSLSKLEESQWKMIDLGVEVGLF